MIENFGFGDFVFRLPDGTEVGRAPRPRARSRRSCAPCRPRASRSTASATTSRTGSRRAPSSRWRTGCGRARSVGLPDDRAPAPAPDRLDPRLSAGAEARHRRRLRPRHVRSGSAQLLPHRRRLARRQGARPRVRRRSSSSEYARAGALPASRIGVPPGVVLGTDVFDRFLDRDDLRELRARVGRRRADPEAACCGAAFPEDELRRPGGVPRRARAIRSRCARRACWRTRRTSHSPASTTRTCCPTPSGPARAARAAARSDQARLRLDVQPARQGLPARDAVPPRRGEDGGDHPEASWAQAHGDRYYPGLRRRRAVAQLLSGAAAPAAGRRGRRRARARRAPWSAARPASAFRRGIRGTWCSSRRSTTSCATRSASSTRSGCDDAKPRGDGHHAGAAAVRARGGGAGRHAGRRGLDLLAGKRRGLRRHLPAAACGSSASRRS